MLGAFTIIAVFIVTTIGLPVAIIRPWREEAKVKAAQQSKE